MLVGNGSESIQPLKVVLILRIFLGLVRDTMFAHHGWQRAGQMPMDLICRF